MRWWPAHLWRATNWVQINSGKGESVIFINLRNDDTRNKFQAKGSMP